MPENKTAMKKGKRGLLRIIFSRTMLITLLLLLNFLYLFSILFDLFQMIPLLFGSMVIFTAAVELQIINSSDDVDVKLTWAVIVAVLPLVGAALYFFVRYDLGNRLNRKLINASVQASLPYVPEDPAFQEQVRTTAPDLYPIARYLADYANAPVFTNTEVAYYPLGEDMFHALLPELEKGAVKRVLFLSTGALMSPLSACQGESIPGIAHAVSLVYEE